MAVTVPQRDSVEAAAAQHGWAVAGHVGPALDKGWVSRWYSRDGRMMDVRFSAKGVVTRAVYHHPGCDPVKVAGKGKAAQVVSLMSV